MRVIQIESRDDPRIEGYRDLKEVAVRQRRGLFVVEGRGTLRCLVERSSYRPRSVLVNPAAFDAMQGVLARLDEETPVYRATRSVLHEVAGFDVHRGCLALAEPAEPVALDRFLAARGAPARDSLIVVLEGLTNLDNVGGVFRNAMAFGVDGVLLCPRCCDPLYRKAIRTSMGATLCVPFTRALSWPEGPLAALREAGYSLVALDPAGQALDDRRTGGSRAALPRRAALLFGTEGVGISPEALAMVDLRLRIDMAAGMDSLNVATASGIALHRFFDGPGRAAS